MSHRTVCAAIIAALLIAASQFAVHYAIDAVARAGTLESRLFQPELRPSDRRNAIALAQTAIRSIR